MAETTDVQQEAARQLLRLDDAQDHLLDFTLYQTPKKYDVNWHHRLITDALVRFEAKVTAKKSPRLLIRMPPRGGKSELGSRKFPAWFLGRNPTKDVIATSYNGDLATSMGGDCLAVFKSEEFQQVFEGVELQADARAKNAWQTTRGGHYLAAGVGEGITGFGADVLIVDDPYKDSKDAWSTTIRKNTWEWFTTTAMTRMMPGAGLLIILTSWHEDGLDNRYLKLAKELGEEVEIIDVPAIMESGYKGRHPLDLRAPGESYWPEWWPVEELMKKKKLLGSYGWSALYQQRAASEAGGIIKRSEIRLYQRAPDLSDFDEIIGSWDLAFKGLADSSRVARHIWGKKGGNFYLLDREATLLEFTETLDAFKAWHGGPDYGGRPIVGKWPQALAKLVEDKANGPALQSSLKNLVPGIIMIPKDVDKPGALRSVSPVFQSGNVYLPDPNVHPWAEDVIEELVKFPNTPYNDDTDCASQALRYWTVPESGNDNASAWEY